MPRELERICLKCLSKRRTDRYNTTDDLREDLQAWLDEEPQTEESTKSPQSTTTVAVTPDSSSGSSIPVKIIPKGLRSFDAEDADFFLELLPGPRDRDGLPESHPLLEEPHRGNRSGQDVFGGPDLRPVGLRQVVAGEGGAAAPTERPGAADLRRSHCCTTRKCGCSSSFASTCRTCPPTSTCPPPVPNCG